MEFYLHKADFSFTKQIRLLRIFYKGDKKVTFVSVPRSSSYPPNISIICNTYLGSPHCSEKGGIHLLSWQVLHFIIVVYDLVFVPKSSITADTAFRKDLSLQGCTTLPTRANRLLTPDHLASSLGGRQRVEGYTLFMRKSIHDPHVTAPYSFPQEPRPPPHAYTPHTRSAEPAPQSKSLKSSTHTQHKMSELQAHG